MIDPHEMDTADVSQPLADALPAPRVGEAESAQRTPPGGAADAPEGAEVAAPAKADEQAPPAEAAQLPPPPGAADAGGDIPAEDVYSAEELIRDYAQGFGVSRWEMQAALAKAGLTEATADQVKKALESLARRRIP